MTRRTALATTGLVLALCGLVVVTAWSERPSTAAPVLDGGALFVAKGCATCHSGPESTSAFGVGPPLVEAASWAGDRRPGTDPATYLAESMRDPRSFLSPARQGDAEMPELTLTDDEIDQLVSYLLGG